MKKWYFLSPLILQKLIWIPTRLLFIFFGHLEIRGLENLKSVGRNAIFACNHSSELDPFFVPASLPFFSRFSPIFYTSRESKFYKNSGWRKHFYGGLFFKAWGAYPVRVGFRDYELALERHIRIAEDGGSICIFPEGGKTPDGTLQRGKGGVAYLAAETDVPVVPVHVRGNFKVGLGEFLACKRRFSVAFGEPIRIMAEEGEELDADRAKVWAESIMEAISKI